MSLIGEATAKAKKVLTQKLEKAGQFCNDLVNHMHNGRDFQEKVIAADNKSVVLIRHAFNEIRKNIARREQELIDQVNQQTNMRSFEKFSADVKKIYDLLVYVNKVIDSNNNDEKLEVIIFSHKAIHFIKRFR